ncbi:MAG: M23 family metallopeptidase [Gemmobacter sp.]
MGCTLGTDCFIQQYPDRDDGPGARDFTCGPLSYDGHDGTDIAVPTAQDMMAGVPVLAAAAGRVLRVRDGVADVTTAGAEPQFPAGQDCGNGVVIDHGGGWETMYCHLRQGRITVRPGEQVAAGQGIGQVGQSGNAAFPHVHFMVRRDGAIVDPFAPALPSGACAADGAAQTLWSEAVAYQPGGILGIGFADQVPAFDAIKQGLAPSPLTDRSPAIVLWVHLFGHRAGDELRLSITGPDGPFADQTETLDRTQARAFRAIGRKIAERPRWPAGRYRAEAVLLRAGGEVDRQESQIDIP